MVLPADYCFKAGDQGVHTFAEDIILVTPGDQTLMASETSDDTVQGSTTVTVGGAGGLPLRVGPGGNVLECLRGTGARA